MRIIFAILCYWFNSAWAKVRPPQELVTEIECECNGPDGRYVIVALRDKEARKVISRTRVFLLADD